MTLPSSGDAALQWAAFFMSVQNDWNAEKSRSTHSTNATPLF